ncbi:MAG: hypothetical protein HONBIEJF_02469 [Fimbriimonadaceae bacterium]|nr:hypothetical protein [Fimbriimonadaceae bacterium]
MGIIPEDVISKFNSSQNQIWQTVSQIVSEASNTQFSFINPLVLVTPTADIYSEMAAPKLVIQFALSNSPENSSIVLLSQETLADMATVLLGKPVTEVDDNVVAEIRPTIEGIVQGMCVAIGNIKNEPIVASGLSIRFQIFNFPPNLQNTQELLRTNIAISTEGVNGSAIWLIDNETAHNILNMAIVEDDGGQPFAAADYHAEGGGGNSLSASSLTSEVDASLEILLDIPLEISVELGRVKMQIKDVLELGSGSIVEIDKAAGEPVDVLVNGRMVARGEVVVIEDNFGVRITEILKPHERMMRLNEVA